MYRALDLFCGAGGASMGLHRAGFDVTGIDIKPQKRYPFRFIQGDALKPPVRLEDFDLVWASPPCQAFTVMRNPHHLRNHNNLIPETRKALLASGNIYVIENVIGAPLEGPFILCGSSFGLRSSRGFLRRHRAFEANFFVLTTKCTHLGKAIGVYGHGAAGRKWAPSANVPEARILMGMPWAGQRGLSQAIPPAYAEHIGTYAIMALEHARCTTPPNR